MSRSKRLKKVFRDEKAEVGSILDMPCGHGRVLRMLGAAFPSRDSRGFDLGQVELAHRFIRPLCAGFGWRLGCDFLQVLQREGGPESCPESCPDSA